MASKQNLKAIDEWQKKNLDKILIKPRKDEHIPARIDAALAVTGIRSRQAYILTAIRERLEKDGA